MPSPADRDALIASARRIGADPLDYATVMSFESGFSPSIRGGAGNRHIGLIQFGIPEQRAYGANQQQSFQEQLPAVEAYLKDRGFKPGMGMLDLYSTINAGRPGRYGASDAANGGTWGTVADKVNSQMDGHRTKALSFLGPDYASAGSPAPDAPSPAAPAPAASSGPTAGAFGMAGPAQTRSPPFDPLTGQAVGPAPAVAESPSSTDSTISALASLLGGGGGGKSEGGDSGQGQDQGGGSMFAAPAPPRPRPFGMAMMRLGR